MTAPRYAIGIDLGTTHCTLAYVDLQRQPAKAVALPIPQLQSLRTIVTNPLLPSFFYYGTEAEIAQAQVDPLTSLPNDEPPGYFIGEFARSQGNALPGRVIHSAKSWLAHAGVDREAPILPFGSDEIAPELRLSPVEASSAYLGYLKEAWDQAFARHDRGNAFVAQRIVITVPASFDEGAQELTRKAAQLCGYPRSLRLLEEPQAAFYAWLETAREADAGSPTARLREALPDIDSHAATVLVCDVGGGTTDFSLFRVAPSGDAPRPLIERVAASDHLLLGGDNIDLLLAHLLERLLKPDTDDRLSRRQWGHLVPQARQLKEAILAAESAVDATFHVAVPGEGAGLFAAALAATVSRTSVLERVLDGFFPITEADEMPQLRRSGLREIGLPYAADSAVSRHLAAFLQRRPVDAVLFAGGTLAPPMIQQRLLTLIEGWQGRRPAQLVLPDMNIAIAEGAASFAALDEGSPNRIRGGYPHSVYLELQRDATQALPQLVCVLPRGFAEGSKLNLSTPAFDLKINRPVRFTAYTSNRRDDDTGGTLVPLDPRLFHPLPTLQTTIITDGQGFNPRTTAADSIRVTIEAGLTELGILEMALVNAETGSRWQLEFNLRKPLASVEPTATVEAAPAGVSSESLAAANARIALFFGKKQPLDSDPNVKSLTRDLERLLNQERTRWNTTLLRSLWPALYPGITRRGRSLAHENTWLYLAGFVLRPGYGTELDAWSVLQLWESFDLGLAHRKEKSAQANWWMMWRRTAGGLPSEQQQQLFDAALPELRRTTTDFVEGTRLLGSLERIALPHKLELCALLIDLVVKGKAANQAHIFWALSRQLGRVPLYTSADTVVPPAAVEESFERLAALDWKKLGLAQLTTVFSAACRRTDLRSLDIDDSVRRRVIDKLRRSGGSPEQLRVVHEHVPVSATDRNQLFGEQLPAGLSLSVD